MRRIRAFLPAILAATLLILPACGGGGGGGGDHGPRTFTMRIENLAPPSAASGVFDTPDGAGTPGPAAPGNSFSFDFPAVPGDRISFVTMYGESNDLFFAPVPAGIALFDASGNPVTGDVSPQVVLYDAGTEVNQIPGGGPDQAPRQSGPNTGANENGPVRPVSQVNDGFTYFTNVNADLAYSNGVFTMRIRNPANSTTPLAPGVWVVHRTPGPFFTDGFRDRGEGLEAAAEDGNPAALGASIGLRSSYVRSMVFDTPVGAGSPGPAAPGQSFTITFPAEPGDRVSFATMYGQSNDLFFAPGEAGIALFDASGDPITGDVSDQVVLWDAGTEVNEIPGAGPNQPPRQTTPDTGPTENRPVRPVDEVNDGFVWFHDVHADLSFSGGEFTLTIENPAASTTPLSPGVLVVHRAPGPIFTNGIEDRGQGLEALAEDGAPQALAERFAGLRDVAEVGVFDTPVGSGTAGPAAPGLAYSFSFDASPGDHLSFATMYVQSNDLFFAPEPAGIPLYDAGGNPLTGDVSGQVQLWDAGTEVNETPGAGPNQPPRQAAFDTGTVETTPIRPIGAVNDGFTWFQGLQVDLAHSNGRFTLTILNPPASPTPLSPGVFVVHRAPGALFTLQQKDRGEGLEALAEDGRPAALADVLMRDAEIAARGAAFGTPISPGVFAVHDPDEPIFTENIPDRGLGLEGLAEDASAAALAASVSGRDAVKASGVFDTPVGAATAGPARPGQAFEVTFDADPGDRLSFATMFGQSNDWFFAPEPGGLALYDGSGDAVLGDVTDRVHLWDAGTETNETPGAGPYQAPRQAAAGVGVPEAMPVRRLTDVTDGYFHPRVEDMIRVTLR